MGCCLCKQKKEDKIPITENMHKATLESINKKELIEIKLLKSQLKNDLANHFNNCVKKIIKDKTDNNKEKLARYLYGKIEEHELECLKNNKVSCNNYNVKEVKHNNYEYWRTSNNCNSSKVYPFNN